MTAEQPATLLETTPLPRPPQKRGHFKSAIPLLLSYITPELLLTEKKNLFANINVSKKQAQRYLDLVSGVDAALEKIKTYPLFFEEFYPAPERIAPHSALEHHVQAYLQDLYILRERLTRYLNCLKQDLGPIAINKAQVEEAIYFQVTQVKKVMKKASDVRDDHTHGKQPFMDLNLSWAKMSTTVLEMKAYPEEYDKEKLQAFFINKRTESFEKAKSEWTERSKRNADQMEQMVEEIFRRTRSFMYQYLNIDERLEQEFLGQTK